MSKDLFRALQETAERPNPGKGEGEGRSPTAEEEVASRPHARRGLRRLLHARPRPLKRKMPREEPAQGEDFGAGCTRPSGPRGIDGTGPSPAKRQTRRGHMVSGPGAVRSRSSGPFEESYRVLVYSDAPVQDDFYWTDDSTSASDEAEPRPAMTQRLQDPAQDDLSLNDVAQSVSEETTEPSPAKKQRLQEPAQDDLYLTDDSESDSDETEPSPARKRKPQDPAQQDDLYLTDDDSQSDSDEAEPSPAKKQRFK